ncbi:PolC-type DNA polymerase III [Sphingobium phage Lacusarx]|uniref:PolC-type DNA polymerase III n=1 Tax=Sphingobium phage Lacusarx TaxID=1980139 RepID=A0A1W6DWR2_9CAUD|nr:DNA polymerase exonuclease subunit [Sphingobium phage Lacusarx]ARK07457.1 PolC-type DNA polymerase III [Sphingobium phage Lacusarx]
MNFLFFDTETTGLPNRSVPLSHPTQPHITQLGAVLQINGQDAIVLDTLIKPDGWTIGAKAKELTGITEEMCEESGIPIADAVDMFMIMAANADFIVCHNTAFDTKLMGIEYSRLNSSLHHSTVLVGKPTLCTMKTATPICKIKKGDGRTDYKWPKLEEAMMFFFGEKLENAHSAIVDIKATQRLFNLLCDEGHYDPDFEAYHEVERARAYAQAA